MISLCRQGDRGNNNHPCGHVVNQLPRWQIIRGTLLRHTKEITFYKSIQLSLTESFNIAVDDLDVKIGFHPNPLSSGQRPRDITKPLKLFNQQNHGSYLQRILL